MKQQMIERRREKLTLNWRPRDQPARRVDDFAEIPHLAVTPAPAAVEPERKEIGARLENWARWATENERKIGSSSTAKMIDRAKLAAGIVEERTGERRSVDEADALRLEQVMRDLETSHRLLLWWCYIRQAQPEVVCRKLSIQHRPATVFVNLFRQAQAAVECLLDKERTKA
jgi:hypothetical protein